MMIQEDLKACNPSVSDRIQPLFDVGTRVFLRACPHGAPGIVTGQSRAKLIVRFEDLDFTGSFRPESLQEVSDSKETPWAA